MKPIDLNDLRCFALTVQHGSFSAAARHSHVPKTRLSRRVALLEERLGARLLQRSTRRLALTEAGRACYEHCAALLVEAEAATQAVERLRAEPAGTVRLSCPTAMAQFYLAPIVAAFMRRHPKVRVELDASDRLVNLIDERFDVAVRTRDAGLADPGLIARRVASGRLLLVASPDYIAAHGAIDTPEQLPQLDTLGSLREGPEQVWALRSTDGRELRLTHRPRLLCSDFAVQYQAALGGVGIALLPQRVAWAGLEDGRLLRVAKDWATPEQDIHLVFASRRGLLPSVRALIDTLAEEIPKALAVS